MGKGPCSTRPAARSLRATRSRSSRRAEDVRLFDGSLAGLPAPLRQSDTVAAAHANQVELIELRRQCLGIFLLEPEPSGYRCNRGPMQHLAARLLEEGAAVVSGYLR